MTHYQKGKKMKHILVSALFVCFLLLTNGAGWWNSSWHYRLPITVTAKQDVSFSPIIINAPLSSTIHNGTLDKDSIIVVLDDTFALPFLRFPTRSNTEPIYFDAGALRNNESHTAYIYYDSDIFNKGNDAKAILDYHNINPLNYDLTYEEKDMNGDNIDDIVIINNYLFITISGKTGEILHLINKKSGKNTAMSFFTNDEGCISYNLSLAENGDTKITASDEQIEVIISSEITSAELLKGRSVAFSIKYTIFAQQPNIEIQFSLTNKGARDHIFSTCNDNDEEYVSFIFSQTIDEDEFSNENEDSLPFFHINGTSQRWISLPEMINIFPGIDESNFVFMNYKDNKFTMGAKKASLAIDKTKTYYFSLFMDSISTNVEQVYYSIFNGIKTEIETFEHINYCGDKICDQSECFSPCIDCKTGSVPAMCINDTFCNTYYGENCSMSSDCLCESGKSCVPNTAYSNSYGCVNTHLRFANGEPCSDNALCVSNNCQNNVCCEKDQICCSEISHCQSGYYCAGDYTCVKKATTGEECQYSVQCDTGYCNNNLCCAEGKICCSQDNDCGYGICFQDEFVCDLFLPEVTVVKTVTKSIIDHGNSVGIDLIIENKGRGKAYDISIEDKIPSGLIHKDGENFQSNISSLNPGQRWKQHYIVLSKEAGNYSLLLPKITYKDGENTTITIDPSSANEILLVNEVVTPTPVATALPAPIQNPTITPVPKPIDKELDNSVSNSSEEISLNNTEFIKPNITDVENVTVNKTETSQNETQTNGTVTTIPESTVEELPFRDVETTPEVEDIIELDEETKKRIMFYIIMGGLGILLIGGLGVILIFEVASRAKQKLNALEEEEETDEENPDADENSQSEETQDEEI